MKNNILIGRTYKHNVHGSCVVVHQNRAGCWIQVWGGPCGDRLYTFKGIDPRDLEVPHVERVDVPK